MVVVQRAGGAPALARFCSPEVYRRLQELAQLGEKQAEINTNGLAQWVLLFELSAEVLDLVAKTVEEARDVTELALKLDGMQQKIRQQFEAFTFLGKHGIEAALSFLYNEVSTGKEEHVRRARIDQAGRTGLLAHVLRVEQGERL